MHRITPMLYRSNIFKSRNPRGAEKSQDSGSDDEDDALCGLEFYLGNIMFKCKKLKCEFTVDPSQPSPTSTIVIMLF